MASYNHKISDQSKVKFNPINRELEDSENSELDSRVDNLEENILGPKTATGKPITVTDAAPVNAVKLSMDLEPIQAGSGTPSTENIRPISGRSEVAINRVGKNLLSSPMEIGNIDGSGNNYAGTFSMRTVGYIPIFANTEYSYSQASNSSEIWSQFYDENKVFISRQKIATNNNSGSFTALSNASFVRIRCNLPTENVLIGDNQLELGTTATEYEPYAGATYTIQLGDTVYGAQFDVTRGKMVVDRGYIASYNGETLPSTWISDRDVYASGTSPTIGAQVVYELATPITTPLTPQQIKMLENTNTLYSDYVGDTITIEYQPNNAIGDVLGEVNDIYDAIIDDIYNKIGSLDTRVTALEES